VKRKNNRLFVRLGGDFLWEKMVNSGKSEAPFIKYYDQPKSFMEKAYLMVYRFVLKHCDKVIFNTRWQADVYEKVFAIPNNRIVIVENPTALENFAVDISAGGANDEIIFAGRFIPLKNLKRLIEAFKTIKTDKKLVLIGDGPQKEELIKLAEGDYRIKIENKIDHQELLKRISRCYMFVAPSLSEMSPNAALEALSLHRRVVLTKENGLAEDIKKYCELVEPLSVNSIKSGMENLLAHEQKNQGRVVSGGEFNFAYGWQNVIDKNLKLFNELNVVNIGIDKTLVGGPRLGDAIERHRHYGEFLDQLDIIVYANKNEGLKEFKISKNVIGHPTNSSSKLMFYFDSIKIFKKINQAHKIDIVVCQDPFIPALIGWRLKRKYGCKLQINFHGDFWDNPSWLKERKINRFFLWISKFTVPRADAIRVMSAGQKEKIIKTLKHKNIKTQKQENEKVNWENRIRVISTPVDLGKFLNFSPVPSAASDKKIILHVGRNDEVKDYETLVKAFKIVKEKFPQAKFLQIGAGSALKSAMEKNNFFDIELKGSQDQNELIKFYHLSDIFVLSSTSESFGKVLIEANACGQPVVSTATTGAKEIIEDGVNGFLAPIGDYQALAEKIIYLLNNPDQAKEMGENGRNLVKEKFGDNTQKIIQLWREIINQ
ncbi:glycosyltransferase family 4 protein, partial [Candidatus Falkowbacteria bacterium]|nr:glycosyltransferase family 4 protein [Candidatus Falkowbacteria bacterium]